jgi:hypothetical protein
LTARLSAAARWAVPVPNPSRHAMGQGGHRPQSSSASRVTASGFLNLSQSFDRPLQYIDPAASTRCPRGPFCRHAGTRGRRDAPGARSSAAPAGSRATGSRASPCASSSGSRRRSCPSSSKSPSAHDLAIAVGPTPARCARRNCCSIAGAWRQAGLRKARCQNDIGCSTTSSTSF